MSKSCCSCTGLLTLALLTLTLLMPATTVEALTEAEKAQHIAEKAFTHPDLSLETRHQEIGQLPPTVAVQARDRLNRLGIALGTARVDQRSGRFITLMPTTPLVPGRGVGNSLTWGDFGVKSVAPSRAIREEAAWAAFENYLIANQFELGIDPAEFGQHRIASHGDGELYQIHIPRFIDGIPVRRSGITASIGHGNLILLSAENWGDREPASIRPQIGFDEAMMAAENYLSPLRVAGEWNKPSQVYLTMSTGSLSNQVGGGYRYVLAWSLNVVLEGDGGSWEVLVDAHTGEILANQDQNHYAEAKGGVYPVTNDGIDPDGVEQPGWPMPFMDVGSATTDTGGNYNLTGSQTASFFGPYVNMADQCGTDSLTQTDGIDWGTSGGDDCTTPGFGGAGNTHASRSGFYELNRIAEMARAHLPGNTWLQNRLTANMNINNTCNAFWNGVTVNFYRSGGGCANTGEIAAVFDHEWGHGMDANDVVGGIASPSGEGIADMYSALRLNDSCIGRNFQPGIQCSGFGDPCTDCTGVRDIDYLKRQSGNPHTYTWSNANCSGQVHCVGSVYAEAMWNLWKRELPAAPYNFDSNRAHEVVTRLTYIAAGVTSTWFSGGPPNGGCSGSSGYNNYLAADDDNGNLNDGTPHMGAIFAAFNTQQIACNTPTVQDSGCAGTPTVAPDVTATSADTAVNLSWPAVSGASEYAVFRAEGIFQCDFGKVKVAETTSTSFTDTGLQNGRDYSYTVIAKGPSDSCFGPASACDTVQPGAAPCSVDADCDDGVFCNGAETCSGGTCQAGSDPCPPTWTCNETSDICEPECNVDADCDDGLFCNGSEVCNAGTCGGGSDPCPGQSCDEGSDICTDTNGPQIAVYDSGLGAPACAIRGSSCDSTTLLDSRNNLSPAEPNQPNTLDSCTDGTLGSYHSDESNDRIVVSSLDGQDFSEGQTVEIAATVWAWTTNTSDTLDLYYAADANNPTWVHITSIVPPSSGANTLTAQYTLPAGDLQAVRANFRYLGSQSSCSGGSYDDADDLVFAVGASTPPCTVDADCDDGAFCNGAEVCNAGVCEAGTAMDCDDGVSCTNDSCNEGTDSCDNVADDANCDDGAFCNGAETCDAVNDCQAGTAPDCDDGVGCTNDSCNEGSDSCDNVADDANCDDGAFCNGAETCDAVNDCQAGTNPCSGGQTCNETTDICEGGAPVTVTFTSIGAEDGWVRESNETSNVGGAANSGGSGARPIRPGDASQDRQYKSILSFDTSSIPDGATITEARFRLTRGTGQGTNPFNGGFGQCLIDVNTGGFSGSTALQASDFQAAATAVAAAVMPNAPNQFDISEGILNAAGLAAINVTGTTQVRIYFEIDDNDDGGNDNAGFYSGDNSVASRHPELEVTYIP